MPTRSFQGRTSPQTGPPHASRGRRFALSLAALAVAAVLSLGGSPAVAAATTSGFDASGNLPQPSQLCGGPSAVANVLRLTTLDGVELYAAVVGSGPRGVVLVHESGPQGLCGWWPYAVELSQHHPHVLLFNMRCYAPSSCPSSGRSTYKSVADVAAAISALRQQGANTVALVGASLGGSVALVSATRLPHVQALVDLSGDELSNPIGGDGAPTTAAAAARHLSVRSLFAVARNDPYVSVGEVRSLLRHAPAKGKTLLVERASAGHGWAMLAGVSGWSQLATTVESFLERNLPGRA